MKRIPTWLMWLCLTVLVLVLALNGYLYGVQHPIVTVPPAPAMTDAELITAVQLASQVTVLHPSYLTYNDQKQMLGKTLLNKVDFIYVEKKVYEETGIYVDALTIMSIAALESGWGSNYWAVQCNNPMSWGINDTNPDRTVYPTATYGVYIAVRGLVSLYYKPGAPYYSLTLWDMNKYYCPGSKNTLAWANGVKNIYDGLESMLNPEQKMRRWNGKTGLLVVPTNWSDPATHTLGWALYKANLAKVIPGR